MAARASLDQKLEVLKRLEVEVYQAAYYIVQDERRAIDVAKAAMIVASRDEDLIEACEETIRKKLRMTVMRCCIPMIQNELKPIKKSRFG
jgi:hypothetical protein